MIQEEKMFNIFKKNRIIHEIVEIVRKSLFILVESKWCANTNKTLPELDSETKCHLKIKFWTDAYFYERLCLKKEKTNLRGAHLTCTST